jgi:hypothetical protein
MKKKPPKSRRAVEPAKPTDLPPDAESKNANGGGNPHFQNADTHDNSQHTLYLKIDHDGNPQWSRMTPRTLETWSSVFKHPASRAQFNSDAMPTENAGAQTGDAEALLGWMATGQALLFSRMTGLELTAAAEICAFSADEKSTLAPRLARLLNKHGGDWLNKYGDEIFFASALGMGIARNFQRCKTEARIRGAQPVSGIPPRPEPPGAVPPEPEPREPEPIPPDDQRVQ